MSTGETLATVAATIQRHRMFDGVRRLGIAVSGGADSVALLYLLLPHCRHLGIEALVLHFEHGLRGEESVADQEFVADIAAENSLPLVARGGEVRAGTGESLEMAARRARMAFFGAVRHSHRLDAIATGHHADDVAETFLLRLMRSSGSRGLSGLRPVSCLNIGGNEIKLIRPLLDCRAGQLRHWLRGRGVSWREDATNRDASIQRNAVRHELLPRLELCGGGDLVGRLARTADILRAEDELLDELSDRWLAAHAQGDNESAAPPRLPGAELRQQPLALRRRILRAWLLQHGHIAAAGFESIAAIVALLEGEEPCTDDAVRRSTRLTLPGGQILEVGSWLELPRAPLAPPPPARLPIGAETVWGDYTISTRISDEVVREAAVFGRFPARCSLSLEALARRGPLEVRARRPGDRIAPLGMSGSRKIQDVMVDAKIPRCRRDLLPLLCCGDLVAWLPGYRIARELAVASGEQALQVSISLRA